jgi:DNA-binding NtrC family response regulator
LPRFVVIEGPNRGAVITISAGINVIGRDAKAQVVLPDPSISRRHAKLIFDPEQGPLLSDLGSTNATYVNGVQLTTPHPLSSGDEVRFADTTVMFFTEGPTHEEGETVAGSLEDTSKLMGSGAIPKGPRPARPRGRGSLDPAFGGARARYMVGESAALRRVSEQISRCAPLDTTVLIIGESGTGKELVAEALHRLGPRRDSPFIVINCATLEPALLESELFGHERGAFTGAVARKAGKLELARDGTLFLDEIGELPLAAQAKLLRAIDRREFTRLGGHEVLNTNARFVAATHRDLSSRVREGDFREDLLFRLRVVEISIPPLRERVDDITPLVQHFLAELREKIPARSRMLTPGALAVLRSYKFPGNARELKNIIERCLIFCEKEAIDIADLPAEVRTAESAAHAAAALSSAAEAQGPDAGIATLEHAEQTQIRRALQVAGGNKSKAAKMLAIDRNTLHAKMKRFGIQDVPAASPARTMLDGADPGTETSVMRRLDD